MRKVYALLPFISGMLLAQELFDANELQKLYLETVKTPQKIIKEYKKREEKLKKEKVNDIYIINSFYENLQKSKYVEDFIFKIPQEIDILVASSIKIIDKKYYVKQNPHWVKVMVYTEPEFK